MGPAGRMPITELYPILARTQPTVRNTTGVKRMSYCQRYPHPQFMFTKSQCKQKLLDYPSWREKTVEDASKVDSKGGKVNRSVKGGGWGVEGAGGG